ncbi:MAG TPA: nuclease [Deltaproteobacteria bacterium]|nr:thermonuclease family protein [Desulfomonilia bacterium]HDP25828.1 nuclease [Deltaproteobacteria bacterium]
MRAYVRWPLVLIMIFLVLGLYHWAKAVHLFEVIEVYDGDTILIEDGRKVRLIGVDAPEVESPYRQEEPFGIQSKDYLRDLILHKKVSLNLGDTPLDKYGRTLAYVYLGDVLINGRIIRDGWARAYRRFEYTHKDLFIAYEKEARARSIGMWQD